MKKLALLFGFFLSVGLATANAQCCASKAACSAKAEKAASADATIEKRLADNGAVSYVRKETDAQGNVRFVSVKYDEGANTFVNVAPPATNMVKKTATAQCTAEGASTTKAACCKSGGESAGKACCKTGASATKACAKEAADQ